MIVSRTALLAIMQSEQALASLDEPWARKYWRGQRPQIVGWRGLAAILEPGHEERALDTQWRSLQSGIRGEREDHRAERTATLECLAKIGPLLPARTGATLSRSAARLLLAGNAPQLRRLLSDLATVGQYSVSLSNFENPTAVSLVQHVAPVVHEHRFQDGGEGKSLMMLADKTAVPALQSCLDRFAAAHRLGADLALKGPFPTTEFRAAGLQMPSRRGITKAEILLDIPATSSPSEVLMALEAQTRLTRAMHGRADLADLLGERERAAGMLAGISQARDLLAREGIDADPWDIPQLTIQRGQHNVAAGVASGAVEVAECPDLARVAS
ncbi:hypothetical protein [Algicella marina]|uniref:Uncharacterized protein n=1 Tax=Algicella marina TaxID=2683284 RepID=A0A6P1T4B3_9RHOB|nr:hypothetical protein [Algicella marina]QHQ36099.1 hypothetical protein GO499_13395 [Algicella marina]